MTIPKLDNCTQIQALQLFAMALKKTALELPTNALLGTNMGSPSDPLIYTITEQEEEEIAKAFKIALLKKTANDTMADQITKFVNYYFNSIKGPVLVQLNNDSSTTPTANQVRINLSRFSLIGNAFLCAVKNIANNTRFTSLPNNNTPLDKGQIISNNIGIIDPLTGNVEDVNKEILINSIFLFSLTTLGLHFSAPINSVYDKSVIRRLLSKIS